MIVRATIPGAAATNGRPERKGYTYNGTGQDQMPWLGDEALAPYRVDYQQWIPDPRLGRSAPTTGGAS